MCILCNPWPASPSSARPATPVRRPSTGSSRHPELELYAVGSDSLAGSDASSLDPRLNRNGGKRVPQFITNAAALACEADITFVCLPHEEAAALVPPSRGIVVDLSGAHRLTDPALYEEWYGFTHPRPDELEVVVVRSSGARASDGEADREPRVLRNGGPARAWADPRADRPRERRRGLRCPARRAPAGRRRRRRTPARCSRTSRRTASAATSTSRRSRGSSGFPCRSRRTCCPSAAGSSPPATSAGTGPDLRAALEEHYAASGVVTVLPEGVAPELARVQGTDGAEIGVFDDSFTDRTIIVCAEDNLGKGAAGQAVQNVNLLFGLPETTGLRLSGVRV